MKQILRYGVLLLSSTLWLPAFATYRLAYLENPQMEGSVAEKIAGCLGLFEFKMQGMMEQQKYANWQKKSLEERKEILRQLFEERAVLTVGFHVQEPPRGVTLEAWSAEDYAFIVSAPKSVNVNQISVQCHKLMEDLKQTLPEQERQSIEQQVQRELTLVPVEGK